MQKTALTGLFVLMFLLGQTQQKNYLDQPYLEIVGIADSLVIPNEIYIKISISENDTKDRTSLEDLELKMYTALKGLAINVEKHLVTTDMASNFKSSLLRGKDVMKSKQYFEAVMNCWIIAHPGCKHLL